MRLEEARENLVVRNRRNKVCTGCGVEKPLDEFHNDRGGKVARCKACVSQRTKAYHRANANKRKQLRRNKDANLKARVVAGYGGACSCCGTTYLPHLTLDHVEGGGHQERQQHSARWAYRDALRRGFPADYQILCHNCNQAKHYLGRCECQEVHLRAVG